MKPFAKVNLAFEQKFATIGLCRGAAVTTSTGTVHPFKMHRAFMVFKPEVFKLLRADDIHWCDVYTQIGPHIDITATVRMNVYSL